MVVLRDTGGFSVHFWFCAFLIIGFFLRRFNCICSAFGQSAHRTTTPSHTDRVKEIERERENESEREKEGE